MHEPVFLEKVGKPVLGTCALLWFIGELAVKVGAVPASPVPTQPQYQDQDQKALEEIHDINLRTGRMEGDLRTLVHSVNRLVTNLDRDREDRRRNGG